MITVASRSVASSPVRAADVTWTTIVDMLTKGEAGAKREELMAVRGIAASLIADKAPEDSPIVVTCDGPRTRIRCVYDEDSIDGSGINEEAFGFDPLKGEWSLSLPCPAEDLDWVQADLASKSTRISARDQDEKPSAKSETGTSGFMVIDEGGFLSS